MQLSHRIGEGINANFVSGWEQRPGIKPLVKQKVRRVINIDAKVVLLAIKTCDRTRYSFGERCLRRFWQRRQMQLAINPDATSHSRLSVFLFKLKRFEPDDERRDHVARVAREDRHSYHFVDSSSAGFSIFADVTCLLRV